MVCLYSCSLASGYHVWVIKSLMTILMDAIVLTGWWIHFTGWNTINHSIIIEMVGFLQPQNTITNCTMSQYPERWYAVKGTGTASLLLVIQNRTTTGYWEIACMWMSLLGGWQCTHSIILPVFHHGWCIPLWLMPWYTQTASQPVSRDLSLFSNFLSQIN